MTLINQQGFDGFCLQLLTRSTASRRPWVFCDQQGVLDHIWCARANRNLFDVIFKAVNPLFWCSFSKQAFRLDETNIFGFLPILKLIRRDMFCVIFWRTNGKFKSTYSSDAWVETSREPTRVAWRMHGKFKRSYSRVAWRMHGKFKRSDSSVAWRMHGEFKRTYSSVAWGMSGKFKRTYSSVAWRMHGKF